jgi:hypothetical protein
MAPLVGRFEMGGVGAALTRYVAAKTSSLLSRSDARSTPEMPPRPADVVMRDALSKAIVQAAIRRLKVAPGIPEHTV